MKRGRPKLTPDQSAARARLRRLKKQHAQEQAEILSEGRTTFLFMRAPVCKTERGTRKARLARFVPSRRKQLDEKKSGFLTIDCIQVYTCK